MEHTELSEEQQRDLALYADVLEQIAVRGTLTMGWLASATPTYPNAEAAALHMRLTLELIPMLGLITHRELVEEVAAAFRRKKPMEAYDLVKREDVNPQFWPEPVIQIPTPEGPGRDRLDPVPDGFLREEDWLREWGWLSSLLHARNPYKGEPELEPTWRKLRELHERIIRLLNLHLIRVSGTDGFILGMVRGDDGKSHAYPFERHGDPPPEVAGAATADSDSPA